MMILPVLTILSYGTDGIRLVSCQAMKRCKFASNHSRNDVSGRPSSFCGHSERIESEGCWLKSNICGRSRSCTKKLEKPSEIRYAQNSSRFNGWNVICVSTRASLEQRGQQR